MSEPMAATGFERLTSCPTCGAQSVEEFCRGLYGSASWHRAPHSAPCGLPCFGGRVSGAAYRTGRAHGLVGYPPGVHPATEYDEGGPYDGLVSRPCPACTGLPPVALADAERIPHAVTP